MWLLRCGGGQIEAMPIEKWEPEREKLKEKKEEKQREKQAIFAKLRKVGGCPKGWSWYHVAGGWRCKGGGHMVSDAQLERGIPLKSGGAWR